MLSADARVTLASQEESISNFFLFVLFKNIFGLGVSRVSLEINVAVISNNVTLFIIVDLVYSAI